MALHCGISLTNCARYNVVDTSEQRLSTWYMWGRANKRDGRLLGQSDSSRLCWNVKHWKKRSFLGASPRVTENNQQQMALHCSISLTNCARYSVVDASEQWPSTRYMRGQINKRDGHLLGQPDSSRLCWNVKRCKKGNGLSASPRTTENDQ
jgi:hypothetical protein